MSAAEVPPPPYVPPTAWAKALPSPAGDGRMMLVLRGPGPDDGGTYYWTLEQARAVFLALRTARVLGDLDALE